MSSYKKRPDRDNQIKREVDGTNRVLDLIDKLPGQKHICLGNHEDRLNTYLCRQAPELFTMLTVDGLLRFKERGWKVTPYQEHMRIGRMYFTHEQGKCGAKAHEQAQVKFRSNVTIGHTHRMAVSYSGCVTGKRFFAGMFGWLGSKRASEYMHSVNRTVDWTLGFGLAYVEPGGNVHARPIPIVDYRCEFDGHLFRA